MTNIPKKSDSLLSALMHEVEGKIAVIRNQEVNQAVRNNPDKFPAHYMFELNTNELQDLRSKISTTNVSAMNRNPTKVFT